MKHKQKRAITLIELLISIFLLGMVVVTAVTVELAMRRMQIKPTTEAKLLDELIPVVEKIKKDFEAQIGAVYNSSVSIEDNHRSVVIRVDSDNSGGISPNDKWHAYKWAGNEGDPIIFYENNATPTETLAIGITDFYVDTAYDNSALEIIIKTKKIPGISADPITNPSVNLTTTVFSRMTSTK